MNNITRKYPIHSKGKDYTIFIWNDSKNIYNIKIDLGDKKDPFECQKLCGWNCEECELNEACFWKLDFDKFQDVKDMVKTAFSYMHGSTTGLTKDQIDEFLSWDGKID